MALHDILSAIVSEADKQIAAHKTQHERTVTDAQTKANQELERLTADLEAQVAQKSDQMTRKAHQRAEQIRRNAVLQRKREMLDAMYTSILDRLSKESDATLEPLFASLLSKLSGGEILPAKKHEALLKKLIGGHKQFTMGDSIDAKGGFRCVSKTREEDFRLETIVHEVLRPRTELSVSEHLFPAHGE